MIASGAPIFAGGAADTFGTVGPMVIDTSGNLLILTARDILEDSLDFTNEAGVPFGTRCANYFHTEADSTSPVELVGWLSPKADTKVELTCFGMAEPARLRAEVTVFCQTVRCPWGFVNGINCSAYVQLAADSVPRLVTGLLRVSAHADQTSMAPAGSCGAPVLDRNGDVIGLIVGEVENDAIVAPISAVLAAENLRLATIDDLILHNLAVSEKDELWSPKRIPAPLVELAEIMQLPVPVDAHQILNQWVAASWANYSVTRQPEAFYPYERFFQSAEGDPKKVLNCLIDFGFDVLAPLEFESGDWSEILFEAWSRIQFDYVDKQEVTGQGSHAKVAA